MDLYPEVNSDARYDALLGQMGKRRNSLGGPINSTSYFFQGSNPLELFKLYVADLKDQVHDGKKIVKQILKVSTVG